MHLHSNCSDGILSPGELVRAAKKNGLSVIALSDHDTVSGVNDAVKTGELIGVKVIPAVELSVAYAGFNDVHLLGYYIDILYTPLLAQLDLFAERREERNRRMVCLVNEMLSKDGKENIRLNEVTVLAGGVIGRPHIARVLIAMGHVSSVEEAFQKYLVPCNIPKQYWAMADAIEAIKSACGVAVLAHPTSITNDLQQLEAIISELVETGLDGIEVYNSMATEYEMSFLQGVARRLQLVVTGGSDFHGINSEDRIGFGRGGIRFAEALIHPLEKIAGSRRVH